MPSHYTRTKRMLRGWAAVRVTAAQLFWLVSGTALYAFAIRGFILPTHLLTGGVTGTAILGHAVFHWHVGLTVLLLNIPIFLLGTRDLGRRFALYSGAAVLIFWIVTDYSSIQPLTRDPMLGAIFGGLLGGMGSAFALRSRGSLGGFDILAVFFNRRFGLGVGEVSLVLNGLLIVAAGFIEKPELAMYTLIGIFVSSRTIDTLQAPRRRKAVLIISDESVSILF
ncbi:MAG: YitT family protein [Acidobacteriota bacterium]